MGEGGEEGGGVNRLKNAAGKLPVTDSEITVASRRNNRRQ